jgi:hypothetical protein
MRLTSNHIVARQRFKEAYQATGGNMIETSKLLGVDVRACHRMRRSIEKEEGIILYSSSKSSPTYEPLHAEFPEWQSLEIENGLVVVFGDAHLIPGIKSTAHRALLKLIHELQPLACIDLGDLIDFSILGRFHRLGWDGRQRVKDEIGWAGECLDEIKKAGSRKMICKRTRGNHDQRFAGFISNRVPELEGISGTTLEDHLPGWPTSWSLNVNDNELCITHRWKSGLHGPFNNALWSGISYVTGHQHKQQIYPLTDLRGDRWGVDCGTLATIWGPLFRWAEGKPRNWRSGFCVLRFVNSRLRIPELVRVVDEKQGLVEWRGNDLNV